MVVVAAVPGQQNVLRTEVAVRQAHLVRRVERVGDLREHRDDACRSKPPRTGDDLGEGWARNQSHRDVQHLFEDAGVVDRHNVRVVERGDEL